MSESIPKWTVFFNTINERNKQSNTDKSRNPVISKSYNPNKQKSAFKPLAPYPEIDKFHPPILSNHKVHKPKTFTSSNCYFEDSFPISKKSPTRNKLPALINSIGIPEPDYTIQPLPSNENKSLAIPNFNDGYCHEIVLDLYNKFKKDNPRNFWTALAKYYNTKYSHITGELFTSAQLQDRFLRYNKKYGISLNEPLVSPPPKRPLEVCDMPLPKKYKLDTLCDVAIEEYKQCERCESSQI
jgi:hypothetical protein